MASAARPRRPLPPRPASRACQRSRFPPTPAEVVKDLAGQVKSGKVVGGILLVQHAAAATVLANRCPSLRAVVGTSLQAVEQGIALMAANVLVIEYSSQSMSQMRNMLSRFVRAKRELDEQMMCSLKELSACG